MFTPKLNLTLKRVDAPTEFPDGIAQAATRTSTIFTGSVQPVTGIELENLTELQKSRDPRNVFTTMVLNTVNKTAGTGADIITYDGNDYVVDKVEPFPDFGVTLKHYKVRMLREDE